MKNSLAGFVISAILHVGLVMLIITMGKSQPPEPPKAVPIPLTLAMFEPKPKSIPEPEPAPEVVVPIEPIPEPVMEESKVVPEPVKEIKPEVVPVIERKPEPKLEEKPKPKKKKVVKKKLKKKKVELKLKRDLEMERLARAVLNPPPQSKPKPVVKPRSRPPVRQVRHIPRPATTAQRQTRPVQRSVSRRVAPQSAPVANNARAEASYRARLMQLLNANKRYPKRAKRMGKQGKVKVSFIILRNGSIKNIRLVSSSGNSSLDSAALKAVKSISGKLPFPKAIRKSQWVFTVPVIYQLR